VKARFLMLWSVAVLATGAACVAHLALRQRTVQLGYDVGDARRAQRRLLEQRRLLAIEAATLTQAERVETVARGSLDMAIPEPARVIILGRERARPPTRISGRVR
jgi:cell division protein FtsL